MCVESDVEAKVAPCIRIGLQRGIQREKELR
jgi:hypothetical protein